MLWIAVPGGTDGGRRVLRVLVVPRLDGGTLEEAGLATWPPSSLLESRSLALEWRAGDDAPVVEGAVEGADVEIEDGRERWRKLFPASLAAAPVGDRTAPPAVAVVPTSSTADAIRKTFAAPAATEIHADRPLPPEFAERTVEGLRPWGPAPEVPEDPPAGGELSPAPGPAAAPPPPPSFARRVSLLREHPAVLRALGLILVLRVTPPDGLSEGQVRVLWPGAAAEPSLPPVVSPWTAYGRTFRPRSTARVSAGVVTLTPEPGGPPDSGRWQVETVDADTGRRRMSEAAATLVPAPAAGDGGTKPPERPVSLPAMRTAGLQLVRAARQNDYALQAAKASANAARESLDGHVLDADDLVLGYRIDVKRGGGEWRSLHERVATYRVDGDPVAGEGEPEEGHVKAFGAVLRDDGTARSDEVVARWSGWSLAAARPRFDGTAGPERLVDGPFEFELDARPGSLPALRFTATYAIRARVADMAGGGLALDDDEANRCAIAEISYGRYEPVPSPVLTLEPGVEAEALEPAEAVDRVVVRSAPDAGVAEFADRNPGYATHARRLLHRPHASLAIAEQHGMLDDVDDHERTFAWVQRALAASRADGGPARPDGEEPAGESPLPDPAAGGVRAFPRSEPGAPAAGPERRDWTRPWPEPEAPKLLELREPARGQPAVEWEGETLVVRLAPAEQMTLEVSSVLTEDFLDHFALQEGMPNASKDAAEAGRHPLITPAQAIALVHAVRRPLTAPAADTVLEPRPREPGQTFAILDPDPPALRDMGVDANSTAQLDVSASWTERDDDQVREVAGASVQSIRVDRGDAELADELRHELGDTRHRDVTYTLTAVTRFRQFFKADEDPEEFVARTTLTTPVDVLNTARPDPPVVLGVRPSFAWRQSMDGTAVVRERLGGRLRVELARPWHVTGDGERLAVILWDRLAQPAPQLDLPPLVTQVGRDPIWETADPERWLAPEAFADTAGPAASPKLVESDGPIVAIPFEPFFHDGRWYADVAVPGLATQSYSPFVQLAVARYQPSSIDGHELSRVVRTDMTPLLPDRRLTVRRGGGVVRVLLEGLGPTGPELNRLDVVLETCRPGPGVGAGEVDLVAFGPPADGVTAWQPVPDTARQVDLGAEAELPDLVSEDAVRVRVREVERIGTDGFFPEPQTGTAGELIERVVFTDAVVLSEAAES
jgi:hypothetical protein